MPPLGRGRGNLYVAISIGIKCQPVRMKICKARFNGEEALRIHTDRMELLKTSAVCLSSPATVLFKGPKARLRKTRMEATDSPHPDWHGFHHGTQPRHHQRGPMLCSSETVLHVTDVRLRPLQRGQ